MAVLGGCVCLLVGDMSVAGQWVQVLQCLLASWQQAVETSPVSHCLEVKIRWRG